MKGSSKDIHCVSQIKYRSVCVKVRVPPHNEPKRIRSKSAGCTRRVCEDNRGSLTKRISQGESKMKSQSESELREDKLIKQERSKSIAAVETGNKHNLKSKKNDEKHHKMIPYTLRISTYRPFECPMPFCKTLVCPSLLLQHLEGCHKQLPSTPFNLAKGNTTASFDVYPRLAVMDFQEPTPVHLLKVNDGKHQPFGILFNLCWLSTTEKKGSLPFGSSSRWLGAWVSCHYLLPIWFKLQFAGYTTQPSFLTFVCKSHEIKFKPTTENVAQGSGVMLVNEMSLRQYYENENALYVEITTYLAHGRRTKNHCS